MHVPLRCTRRVFSISSAILEATITAGVGAVVALIAASPVHGEETLRGKQAVEHLKEQGDYESLLNAVTAARQTSDEAAGLNQPDAVGQSAKLLPPDGAAYDRFGTSVSISGETAVVGAPQADVGTNVNQGAAYVFIRNGTAWIQQQKLVASDGVAADNFGQAVAISGDTIVVAAPFDDIGANSNQGSAYVFVRSGNTWTQQQQLIAADGAANDQFGLKVAITGETLAISAVADDVGANVNQGSAYVFVRSSGLWSQQQKLVAMDGIADAQFGSGVAIGAETIVVGAGGDTIAGVQERGSAYIFIRSGTVWTQQQKLVGTDSSTGARFGTAVAISGETVAVGAREFNAVGAVYVFVRGGTNWTLQQKLTASDPRSSAEFGGSVGISGEIIVAGADFSLANSAGLPGNAYVFVRNGTAWTQQQKLTAEDAEPASEFGGSVAISGSQIIVGTPRDDIGANEDQGSAYVFRVLGTNWVQEPTRTASDGAAGDSFGFSVAMSGDTAVIGAHRNDVGTNADQGSAYIFVRSGETWTQQQLLTASDGAAGDNFGFSVAISGDTAIIGAPFGDGPQTDQGSAYVFVRSGTVWVQQQRLSGADGTEEDQFGYSVGISGDRAVIGARTDSLAFFQSPNQGSAFVFRRANNTWTQQVKLVAADGSEGDLFGGAVAISGDTLVVGAASDDVNGITNQGSAYIFVFANNAWVQQAQLRAADGAANDFFGFSVAMSGETVLVGATSDNVGANADQGSAYVFVRNGTAWSQQQQLFASNGTALDSFGNSVAINNGTAVVGAYLDDVGGNTNQGSAYVFEQLGTIWVQRQQLIGSPAAALDRFGNSVAISGDKIVVGAPLFDAAAVDQGAAYFFQNVPSFVPTAAASRKTHGIAGSFDIPLPLAGTPAVECRSSNGAHTLVFTFSNNVVSGSASVTAGTGSVSGAPAFSGQTMTVNLTGVTDVQKITVALSNVTDSFGQVLPDAAVSMNLLVGDINSSKVVNTSDIGAVKAQSGLPVTAVNFRADVAVNGSISTSDIGLVKSRSGQSVP
jgi:hypothetical protein